MAANQQQQLLDLKPLIALAAHALPSTLPSLGHLQQRPNAALLIRRIHILALLFQDLDDDHSKAFTLPSAVLCFRELCTAMDKLKLLLDSLLHRSCIWQVLEHDSISHRFYQLSQDMANALDILPLRLLNVSEELCEQVELVYLHLRKARPLMDAVVDNLRLQLLSYFKDFERQVDLDIIELQTLFAALGLNDAVDCQREIQLLRKEMNDQAGTGGVTVVSNISNLIDFVGHCQSLLYQGSVEDFPRGSWSEQYPQPNSTSGFDLALSGTFLAAPDEFRCPISLELMRDPVVVATGHTYDRTSIARWLESGNYTCPKSGQKLLHVSLIPNYALRSMIRQWCDQHNIPFDQDEKFVKEVPEDHISSRQAALQATKETAAYLVGRLATGSSEVQRQVAYELRLLAKCGMENRICIAEAGAIPFLVRLLSSQDHRTQENAVTALLNLSICENNKSLIVAAGALDAVIEVVRGGRNMEARENAAATLFSLSVVNEYKILIGSRPDAIPALVSLIREGSSRGKKDAATALFNVSMFHGNKTKVVAAGAIPLLVDLLTDERAGITDDSLAVLAVLAVEDEGVAAISQTNIVPVLVDLLRLGTVRGKDNSIAVLLALCRTGGQDMVRSVVRLPTALPSVQSIAARGSSRAKRKASSLLRLLNKYDLQECNNDCH